MRCSSIDAILERVLTSRSTAYHTTKAALTSLNLSSNRLVRMVLPTGWKQGYDEYDYEVFTHTDGRKQAIDPSQPDVRGFSALADAVPTMGALLTFNISDNDLCAAGGKVLAEALKGHPSMTELNIASNSLGQKSATEYAEEDMSGIVAIGNAIPTMGAIVKVHMSQNKMLTEEAGKAMAEALAANSPLKELDLSSNNWEHYEDEWQGDGPEFANELVVGVGAANGALTAVNVLSNDIRAEQANELIALMGSKPNLRTLCGFSGDETEIDLSDRRLVLGDGVLVANEVPNNGALTSLNLSDNRLGQYWDADQNVRIITGLEALATAVAECK